MNSLSWMMYLAEVLGNISCISGGLMIPTGLVIAGATLAWAINHGEYDKSERASAARVLKVAARLFVSFALVAIFLPSSKTIYAIAASEYGEEALKTPEASKARQALNAWLDKQIEQKPEKSE